MRILCTLTLIALFFLSKQAHSQILGQDHFSSDLLYLACEDTHLGEADARDCVTGDAAQSVAPLKAAETFLQATLLHAKTLHKLSPVLLDHIRADWEKADHAFAHYRQIMCAYQRATLAGGVGSYAEYDACFASMNNRRAAELRDAAGHLFQTNENVAACRILAPSPQHIHTCLHQDQTNSLNALTEVITMTRQALAHMDVDDFFADPARLDFSLSEKVYADYVKLDCRFWSWLLTPLQDPSVRSLSQIACETGHHWQRANSLRGMVQMISVTPEQPSAPSSPSQAQP